MKRTPDTDGRSLLGPIGAWISATGNMLLATVAVLGASAAASGPKTVLGRLYDQRLLILIGLLAQGVGLLTFALAWLSDGSRPPIARAVGAIWIGYVVLAAAFVAMWVNLSSPGILPVLLGATALLVTGCAATAAVLLTDRDAPRRTSAFVGAWGFGAAALVAVGAAVLLGMERWLPGLLALAALGLAGAVALGASGVALLPPPPPGRST